MRPVSYERRRLRTASEVLKKIRPGAASTQAAPSYCHSTRGSRSGLPLNFFVWFHKIPSVARSSGQS